MAANGNFVWFDLMTPDVGGAIRFYSEIVGWSTADWDMDGSSYTMFAVGEETVGGGMVLSEEAKQHGAPPHWLAHILVGDVDAAAKRVGELGGSVMLPPTDIPSIGRFSVVADPQGAVVSLFQALDPAGMSVGKAPGHFTWMELATTDQDAAWRFYQEIAGFQPDVVHDMGPMGPYRLFKTTDSAEATGGMWNTPDDMPGPPNWLPYVSVSDLDAAVQRVRTHGGQVLNGPMEVPGGDRIAQCMDPQGAAFALHEPAAR